MLMQRMGADRKTGTMEKTLGPLLTGADRKGAYWLPSQTDHGVLDAVMEQGGSVSDLMAALAIAGTRHRAEGGPSGRGGGRGDQSYRMSAEEEEERMANYGFTKDEVMELDAQGVDPWDVNARVGALVYARHVKG